MVRIFRGIDEVDIAVSHDSKVKYRQLTEGNGDGISAEALSPVIPNFDFYIRKLENTTN